MQAFDMIKIERSIKNTGALFIFLMMFGLFSGPIQLSYAEGNESTPVGLRTIVIDPGHGGYDTGAQGQEGIKEKELALKVAQILAKELKQSYEVVFTRNGDYQVDLTRRVSVANHHEADIFVSIHAGGSSRYQMDAWSIYYYKNTDHSVGGRRTVTDPRKSVEDLQISWEQIQLRHQRNSRALAGCVKTQLAGNSDIREVTVAGAALRVLEGLDMPAIIIEIGYLTNPKTEKRVNNISFLADVAKRIKEGVDIYLTR